MTNNSIFSSFSGIITQIIDGDTIEIRATTPCQQFNVVVGNLYKIRFSGTNAPEIATYAGLVAKANLGQRVPIGASVNIYPVAYSYGRIVADVWCGMTKIN